MRRAIREHLRDFVAIGVLAVVGLAVAVAILSQQKQPYPSWIPILGDERFELKAEFSTAQAVVAGQGQTVNLSGVEIGQVGSVDLEEGRAVVTLSIEEEYAPLIRRDATLLLRPRTGLNDMTVEIDPGTAGESFSDGETIPISQTQPNVQPDQILATLDADTRGYLKLLLAGGAEGLGGRGEELSATLRRFEPLGRNLAEMNRQLAERRQNIRGAITNFRLLSEELARRDVELARFVESSNASLGAFAEEEASIRAALRELPPTLRATRSALNSAGSFAEATAPALRRLVVPSAALGPALREVRPFLERTYEPIREQIRPFTTEVRKPVKHLRGAGKALEVATPALRGGFTELNTLLNMLAYNPPGGEEGYLYWGSWLNHTNNAMFFTQDANGPLRHGMVLLSCITSEIAEEIGTQRPFIATLLEATRVPSSAEICPFDQDLPPAG